ncbi:ORF1 [Myodefec virus RodL3_715]|uniref:Capsid protein n=1 Tax=Myodefec virus RodL3_715 TaxID=2929220 RepID=A0A976R5G3_9VIRU|nr:ORF1 [Myodefec virus RodL3_715]
MAYAYGGRNYHYRRRGARRRTWRRRTYRRRASRRPGRRRRWRRGRKHVKVRVLTEIQPRFQRRCVIRGIMCPLMIGQPTSANTDKPSQAKEYELKQGSMFGYKADGTDMWMGTWSMGLLTLEILYEEHQLYRNRWSSSNCGFDLVNYRGTTVYLEQHSTIDYIAFFDEEFKSLFSFAQQATVHPLLMITHPKTILVKSKARAGPRRARKVFIPRPSWWDSGWQFSKDICKTGVFVWYVCAIDLEHPWLENHFTSDAYYKEAFWWKGKEHKWKEDYDTYVRTAVQTAGTNPNANNYKDTMGNGPLMLRVADYVSDTGNKQLIWFYKSYWHWAGNNLTLSKICNPCLDVPVNPTQ